MKTKTLLYARPLNGLIRPDGEQYSAYKQSEEAMDIGCLPISPMSIDILRLLSFEEVTKTRRGNAAYLCSAIDSLKNVKRLSVGVVPFCVPVLLEDAGNVAARMAKQGVFCARHWPHLATPKSLYSNEWRLSQRLLSLPCDHRYDVSDMEKVVRIFKNALRGKEAPP